MVRDIESFCLDFCTLIIPTFWTVGRGRRMMAVYQSHKSCRLLVPDNDEVALRQSSP